MESNILFSCNHKNYENDLCEILRAFDNVCDYVNENLFLLIGNDSILLQSDNKNVAYCKYIAIGDDLIDKRNIKRQAKILLYDYMSKKYGIELPYGSLTGIRPTKLLYEISSDVSFDVATNRLVNDFRVSRQKANIIKKICENQRGIYRENTDEIDLFINIPICISRCSYCSFVSIIKDKLPKKMQRTYIECLVRELNEFFNLLNGKKVRSIYVGGGTPTSLDDDDFNKIMDVFIGNVTNGCEFTIEAGRPDTITENKLQAMKRAGVTRVSVNPQSLKSETLTLIGRSHTVDDFYRAYSYAKSYGFDINCDLIAMLPNENEADFGYSINEVIKLAPENITVHTLAIKRGSVLDNTHYGKVYNEHAFNMVQGAYEKLTENGYEPYYMYRLKNMSGGHENIGYAKNAKFCIYNIDIMEETHNVYAIGAGGISKKISSGNLLERFAVSKDIYFYIEHFDEMLKEKVEFFADIL